MGFGDRLSKCHIDGGDNIHKTKQQIVRQRFISPPSMSSLSEIRLDEQSGNGHLTGYTRLNGRPQRMHLVAIENYSSP